MPADPYLIDVPPARGGKLLTLDRVSGGPIAFGQAGMRI